ncbi:MAG: amidohydrolase [Rhodoluna sp.]
MVIKLYNGKIYLGDKNYGSDIYIDQAGVITSERAYEESVEKSDFDLKGNFVVPAFRDSHAHPLFAGRELLGAEITGLTTLAQIGEKLQQFRSINPDATWLDGASYDRNLNEAKTRQALDQYVSDIPVVLHAEDHHTLWVNTKALEAAGLMDGKLPELAEGGIDIGKDGLPSGILREWQAMQLVLAIAPKFSLEQDVAALLAAEKLMLAAGIVEIQDAWIERGMAEVYLAAQEQLQLRYKLAFRVDSASFEEDFRYAEQLLPKFEASLNIKCQAIKFFIDGVFGSATAAVIEPYKSTGAHGDLNWNLEDLVTAIGKTHKAGLQTHIHAIGDKGVDFALEAIAKAAKGRFNPVIAHAELTSSEIIQKAKNLGAVLCVQPFWAQYNGMLNSCSVHLGEKRLDSLYAIRSMIENQVTVAFSSDWPVSSYKPLDGITVAVNRRFSKDQQVHNPSEAISLEQALDCYSCAVSNMFGSEETGKLAVGEPFDAVILSKDLTEQNLGGFLTTEVLAVYVAGARLFPYDHH